MGLGRCARASRVRCGEEGDSVQGSGRSGSGQRAEAVRWRKGTTLTGGSIGSARAARGGCGAMWINQPELYRLKYASPILRAPTCFKRYNPLACRVTSR
jgi:hypothetical protein